MELKDSRHGQVVVVEIEGEIDSRTSHELEQRLVESLGEGSRFLVIDFSRVDQLTSAGLRVLVMIANQLAGIEGKLALASPNPHVKQVLEISGLSDYFKIVSSREDAIAELSSADTPSKVSVLAMKLLSGSSRGARDKQGRETRSGTGTTSKLSAQVADILSGSGTSGSKKSPRDRSKDKS